MDPETKNRVDRHLAECHACREDLAALKALVHELGSMEPIQPPEDFLVQVHERLEKSSRFSKLFRTLFLPFQIKWPLQLAGAAAMAILVFSLVYFQQEEFKAPVATLQEDRGADGLTAPEDRAPETKARSALEQTAPKEPQVDARPIEVALLLREDRMPRAHEPGGAPPPPSEKKETKTARRAFQSANLKKEEGRTGVDAEDKALYKVSDEHDPLGGLNHLIRSLQGKVLSVHRDKDTRQPDILLAQIPASRWEEFKEQLKALGDLKIPAESGIEEGQEDLQVRIRLLPQNHGQRE
jgi:hypothetical protein